MKKTSGLILFLLATLTVLAPSASAYESWANVFGGWMGTDWFDTDNWTQATVPDYNDGISTSYSVTSIDGGTTCIIAGGSNASFYKMRMPYSLGTTGVGTATLNIQSGATVNSRSYIDMGFTAGDTAIINADQAELDITSEIKCGIDGDGFLTLNNSDMTVGSYIFVARDGGSNGNFNINDSVVNIPNSYITIGVNADANGTVSVTGSSSELYIQSFLSIGHNGKGTFNLDAGVVDVNGSISVNATSTGQGGTLNISGGVLNGKDTNIGPSGQINMTGGQLNVDGRLRIWEGSNAQINLHGGTVVCDTFLLVAPMVDIDNSASLVINNDSYNLVKGYIDDGWITGGGDVRKVAVSYDDVADTTTLTLGSSNLMKMAYAPEPARDNENISRSATLVWSAGDGAVSHTLYLSQDYNDVANASIAAAYTGTQAEYKPETLDSGTVYYWRVDEYDGSETIAGEVWAFETGGLVSIDNFDGYADTNDLLLTWTPDSSADISLIAGGSSNDFNAELAFDNSASPYYSQATRTVPITDFTAGDMKALDVWYRGLETNTAEPVFVTLSDGVNSATVVTEDPNASQAINIIWHIALSEFTDNNPSLDLTSIDTISIGIGDKLNPSAGGTGTVEFDDIALWENRCFEQLQADFTGDCIVDFADFAEFSLQWLTSGLWPND